MELDYNRRLDNIEDKVDKILVALTGNELGTDQGLIKEFKEMRDRVTKLEAVKNKLLWVSIGAGAALGLSLPKIWEFIQEIILKK